MHAEDAAPLGLAFLALETLFLCAYPSPARLALRPTCKQASACSKLRL